jgi:Ca2+-transporting ATPase
MTDFYRLGVEQALTEMKSNAQTGLTEAEASQRLERFGRNTLPKGESASVFTIFLSQFKNLLVIVLIVAAVLSFVLGDIEDAIVILIIVILNAALGTYQEYQAEKALEALSGMQVPSVKVRRDGALHEISAEEVVPGDILVLGEGDAVPADGRVIVSANLRIEEAALTGESEPASKVTTPVDGKNLTPGDQKNMAFMGTAVNYGRGELLITCTGSQTQLGQIATLMVSAEDIETPLQRQIAQLSKVLVIGALGVVAAVFVVGVLRGLPIQEMLLVSLSLAVAAVPEGLPAVITIALSNGASRMVRRNALMRKLPAVETLGSVTTICTDKTGTLTKNEMTATLIALPNHDDVVLTGVGYTPEGQVLLNGETPIAPKDDPEIARILVAMALNTDAEMEIDEDGRRKVLGDTTEAALLVAADKAGLGRSTIEAVSPRIAELPFSSERKAMTTIHDFTTTELEHLFRDSDIVATVKGAPDRLLSWATYEDVQGGATPLTDERRAAWQAQTDRMASQGLRVIGVAYKTVTDIPDPITPEFERDLTMLGLVGIVDPARPEAREAIKVARSAGIRSIMITGDHALTAEAIGRDLGIVGDGEKAITGSELSEMDDEQIEAALKHTSVFARVAPEHKMRLVKVLQSGGQVVAMTGDGVNDAPALKQADIGVAMGITGTEVSKSAADMVLTDDNYASIVAAVEEGRLVYQNIRKFILFLLSSNVGEILVMFVGILAGLPVPLLAIQILWVNLLTDGLPAIALGFDPPDSDLMRNKPRAREESVFSGGLGRKIIWRSVVLATVTLIAFVLGHAINGLDPLDPTLGVQYWSAEQIETQLGVTVPDGWDSLSAEARADQLTAESETNTEHSGLDTVLGKAETLPRTLAFTVLALGQIFHVLSIHAGSRSFFRTWFSHNRFMLWATLATVILQVVVIYVPFMQNLFGTYPLTAVELLLALVLASVLFWIIEIPKLFRPALPPRETVTAQ